MDIHDRQGSKIRVKVDHVEYVMDLLMVEDGVYSVILNGKSYNIEMIQGAHSKAYHVNTLLTSYDVEIFDAEAKYLRNRNKGLEEEASKQILSPMPGRVVNVLVKPGEEVSKGQTLVIVSAMKMESEFKAAIDGKVKDVNVKAGDTVDGGRIMITLE